jgi:hypothetical protein
MRPTWQISHKPLNYIRNNSGDVVKPHYAKGIKTMIISNIEHMTAVNNSSDIVGGTFYWCWPKPKTGVAIASADASAQGPKAFTYTGTAATVTPGTAVSSSYSYAGTTGNPGF